MALVEAKINIASIAHTVTVVGRQLLLLVCGINNIMLWLLHFLLIGYGEMVAILIVGYTHIHTSNARD